jgi:hypothetical protein
MQHKFLEIKENWTEGGSRPSSVLFTASSYKGGVVVTVTEPGIGEALALIHNLDDIRKMRDFLSNTIKEME